MAEQTLGQLDCGAAAAPDRPAGLTPRPRQPHAGSPPLGPPRPARSWGVSNAGAIVNLGVESRDDLTAALACRARAALETHRGQTCTGTPSTRLPRCRRPEPIPSHRCFEGRVLRQGENLRRLRDIPRRAPHRSRSSAGRWADPGRRQRSKGQGSADAKPGRMAFSLLDGPDRAGRAGASTPISGPACGQQTANTVHGNYGRCLGSATACTPFMRLGAGGLAHRRLNGSQPAGV